MKMDTRNGCNELVRTASCIYVACDKWVADDISNKLKWAVNEIHRLAAFEDMHINGRMKKIAEHDCSECVHREKKQKQEYPCGACWSDDDQFEWRGM